MIEISEQEYSVLQGFSDTGWNVQKIQNIIHKIQESKNDKWQDRFTWGNEDVILYSFEEGVAFYDLLKARAQNMEGKEQDLILSHDEFIEFLEDFKQFVAENQ
ncbi:hypothetical protein BST97_07215 [Nonlabens spongiae]|uniref:Uncharacterized protein n=1 Tax=Nonlabens spongiae TaxID=331648 RepID=A0A1W6MJL8_9FLAO|nr:hypothetical protein [Nonlabens spongiae]ARN77805.1 hypothetical protein BST97_07215 [Nonlabens spongiae]